LLTFLCALLSLTLQLATRLLFLLPISPYLHSFCALLSLTLQLATGCSFSYLSLLTYIPFALCLPYTSQLATRLRYPFPISFNLQQYNLFLNQVIFKKSCHFKVFKLFFSYFK
ncbi:hypothetical protein P4K48_33550, partial [Bacillus anthracis]|nr:hypothetical protein [Bacillus anthracis]